MGKGTKYFFLGGGGSLLGQNCNHERINKKIYD